MLAMMTMMGTAIAWGLLVIMFELAEGAVIVLIDGCGCLGLMFGVRA